MNDQRPNPDELLERVQRDEEKARRGKLKVFFGASAGVGKTFAMLSAARQLRNQGLDVLVGLVETHGRAETMALLEGSVILPLKEIEYRGKILHEFDLDAALQRHPTLILVDELAHTNVQGSRHPKRWQDLEELLAAGIDVYTTLNVQHLESLNDIIGAITGIRVWETVPDKVFDQADEVVLVDITPDELLQRLHDGKVYIPQQAQEAIRNFFRKGNLIALRELSLRRTADRVDDQMRTYRQERSIDKVWQTKENLLVCVGPQSGAEKVVRRASRLASELDVEWHAVYVETPDLQRLPSAERDRILHTLRLAHELGAQTATLSGQDEAETVVEYAYSRNLTKLVIGRDYKGWRPWRRSFAERIGRLSADLDIIQVVRDTSDIRGKQYSARMVKHEERVKRTWQPYAWSIVACAVATLVGTVMRPYFELANIVMVFLLAVVLVGVKYDRGPSVMAAFLSVIMFDFFLVPPRFSFAVSDAQYLVTFAIMFAVALVIGHLTTNLRYQAQIASQRETRLRALYEMARDLSGVLLPEQIIDLSHKFIEATFGVQIAILLADDHDKLQPAMRNTNPAPTVDASIAQWSFDHNEPAGFGTDTLPGSAILYLPLRAPMRMRGILAIESANPRWLLIPEQRRQMDGFAALIATALERVHYIDVAQDAVVRIESERLRNSVLSALSHDLRTPLTALVGLADTLIRTPPTLSEAQLNLANALQDQAFRMNALVNNLLDMARLQSGNIKLNMQWQPLEEVVGSAQKAREHQLADHRVHAALPADFPLLEFDAVLIERVLCNLLENAAKYTPPDSDIHIAAAVRDGEAQISVTDNGPGLPHGGEETIFEKFTRGEKESTKPGVGLGLAICRAIVEAHKGRIWAENVPTGGARFVFTLPLGTPPSLPTLLENMESNVE
ncbi:two-component system sensor histidine kinase KdpD [Sulfuriferula nivalis]|uniref:histidine kinase n=1 Tax=Sulfuriferula nivalis TaxID=2675298 RepID=A0A809RG99_9PROT|nr:two-component system sensor histidine kinase KdpD [Sulfuriferula nivalis]BBP00605.1 two-component sensor histidine kinase [Sulfuriferula nivalis]